MFTAEDRAKAQEARRHAIPKAGYAAAIRSHCLECVGTNAAISACNGVELLDGTACRLFHVSTNVKRRQTTKTALRRAILQECKFCMW